MKKGSLFIVITLLLFGITNAQNLHLDSIPDTLSIEGVIVNSLQKNKELHLTNTSYLSSKEIAVKNTGRDLPFILQFLPSVISTSDAGNGIGYTGIRVRGSDATRINVTINGVPLNDPESQGVFWVNLPDFSSSLQAITIQRGVGASTNGPGAFGGSILLETKSHNDPYAESQTAFGSFGTFKQNLAMGTGLIHSHFTFDARLSYITSNGYIDRAFANLQSYFFSFGYQNKKYQSKWIHFNGKEHTYQAWYGTPLEKLSNNDSALHAHYQRNIGSTYKSKNDSLNLFSSGRTYNYYTYKNETDNYQQAQYQWLNSYELNSSFRITATAYLVTGKGYFEQFRLNDAFENYQLAPVIMGNDTITHSDLVRRRWLDNYLFGVNILLEKSFKNTRIITGFSANQYRGKHYGTIQWARFASNSEIDHLYYNGIGNKDDANAFIRVNHYSNKLPMSSVLDLQIRRVSHLGNGTDNDQSAILFHKSFIFFNPKWSLKYLLSPQLKMIADLGIANREPARTDFIDPGSSYEVLPERLYDLELGFEWHATKNKKNGVRMNTYYMHYENQLVLTGALNDVGAALRTNVNSSYRAGLEIESQFLIAKNFTSFANLTLSRNKIKLYKESLNDYLDYSIKDTIFYNTDIAYSPSRIATLGLEYVLYKNCSLIFQQKWVSKQFLDNTSNIHRSLPAYTFGELLFRYSHTPSQKRYGIVLWAQCINIFNAHYSSNGYTFSYYYGKPSNYQPITEVYLYPQAGRNFLIGLHIQW